MTPPGDSETMTRMAVPGTPIEIRSSRSPVTLLRAPDADHFRKLSEKLNWGV